MTPNLKLQEAVDFMKAIDKYDYDTERFRDYLKTLISAAQSILAEKDGESEQDYYPNKRHYEIGLPKPSGEVFMGEDEVLKEIWAYAKPETAHPESDGFIHQEDFRPLAKSLTRLPKQMTVVEIENKIEDFAEWVDNKHRIIDLNKHSENELATAIFEAVYGSNK